MTEEFIFRKAKIKDLKDIQRLNFELFKKEYKEFDRTLNLNWTRSEKGKKYFKEKIIGNDNFVEVIEWNNKIIGYICGHIKKKEGEEFRISAKYAELDNMLIEREYRRKGLGTKLTNDFKSWCRQNKVDYIWVMASAKNKPSIKFYKKSGFKEYTLWLDLKINK